MGSMGILLTDFLRSKIGGKQPGEYLGKIKKYCKEILQKVDDESEALDQYQEEEKELEKLLGDNSGSKDVIYKIKDKQIELSEDKLEIDRIRSKQLKFAESIGKVLTERDSFHMEIIKEMEGKWEEQEKQVIEDNSSARQQLRAEERSLRRGKNLSEQLDKIIAEMEKLKEERSQILENRKKLSGVKEKLRQKEERLEE